MPVARAFARFATRWVWLPSAVGLDDDTQHFRGPCPLIDFSLHGPYAPFRAAFAFCAALKGAVMRARAALIGSLVLVWSLSGAAQTRQRIPPGELEDKVLGWMKVYDYKGATTPITHDHRVYSPAQLSIAQLFAHGM